MGKGGALKQDGDVKQPKNPGKIKAIQKRPVPKPKPKKKDEIASDS